MNEIAVRRLQVIFESQDTCVDFVEPTDIYSLVAVYNSHPAFLTQHLQRKTVTYGWLTDEIKIMRNAGFLSCKVVGKASGAIHGLIDVKIAVETYLSLLMIHQDSTNQGLGQQVYTALEAYVRRQGCRTIRIDVITGYSDRVLNFWRRNGFHVVEDATLNWDGVRLPAVILKKRVSGICDGSLTFPC